MNVSGLIVVLVGVRPPCALTLQSLLLLAKTSKDQHPPRKLGRPGEKRRKNKQGHRKDSQDWRVRAMPHVKMRVARCKRVWKSVSCFRRTFRKPVLMQMDKMRNKRVKSLKIRTMKFTISGPFRFLYLKPLL